MNKEYTQRSVGAFLVIWCAIAAISQAAVVDEQPSQPIAEKEAGSAQIFGLVEGPSGSFISGKDKAGNGIPSHVGLNGKLWVVLTQPLPQPPEKYALFMNGMEVKGLEPALDDMYQSASEAPRHALVFTLQRNKNNDAMPICLPTG